MTLFQWKEDYSVNVREFDGHHMRLVEYINELYDAMRQGKGRNVLSITLSKLISYTISHFEAEEEKMKAMGFPNFASHKAEHEKLTSKVLSFRKEFELGNTAVTVQVMQFLRDWLRNHILITDKKYSSFLNERGVN